MKIKLSPRAARYFRLSLLIAFLSGVVIGLVVCAVIPDFRTSVMFWILMPLIIGAALAMLDLGFYLIFLNQKQ